jgi:hopanoid biosynthesis associated protein HpnK
VAARAGGIARLIVTADDFGAAIEVNEAVEAAHRSGILTAASLMVSGPAAGDAVARAVRNPSLRVGLHLVLVDGRPVLPPHSVSRLVNADGSFRCDMAAMGALFAASAAARRQLAAEIAAQFEAFRATGLALDHCNAHKHYHLHPLIGSLIASIGLSYGLRAARVPLEPAAILRKIEPSTPRLASLALLPWALLLRRRFRAAGIFTCDRVFGLQWSGGMTRDRLCGLIAHLPPGLSEIYLHPATAPYPGCAPGYRYREELEVLTSPEAAAACRERALQLGGFADFTDPRAQATSLPRAA